jgi:hypothetical protein
MVHSILAFGEAAYGTKAAVDSICMTSSQSGGLVIVTPLTRAACVIVTAVLAVCAANAGAVVSAPATAATVAVAATRRRDRLGYRMAAA